MSSTRQRRRLRRRTSSIRHTNNAAVLRRVFERRGQSFAREHGDSRNDSKTPDYRNFVRVRGCGVAIPDHKPCGISFDDYSSWCGYPLDDLQRAPPRRGRFRITECSMANQGCTIYFPSRAVPGCNCLLVPGLCKELESVGDIRGCVIFISSSAREDLRAIPSHS